MADRDFVRFKELRIHDAEPSWALEDSIVHCAALGGLHFFDFLDEIDESTLSDLGGWDTGSAEGTWTADPGKLKGVGGGAAQWYRILHSTELPPSFVATFDKEDSRGAFVFCAEYSGPGYMAYWTAAEIGFASLDADGVATTIASLPVAYAGNAEIAVAVKLQQMTDFDVVDWISMAMYVDGRMVISASEYVETSPPGNNVGFATYQSDTVYYDNFNVPELRRIVEWTSVDPGEPVAAGLNRAVATTPVFYFCRFDGVLQAWVPADRGIDWTIPNSRIVSRPWQQQHFVPAHVRMVGALHEADVWETDRQLKQARPIFGLLSDPNLVEQSEVLEGAEDAHRIIREKANGWSDRLPGSPLIEPQDRIQVDDENLRVQAVQFDIGRRRHRGAPEFMMQVEATAYIPVVEYHQKVLSYGPVAYWPVWETEGSVASCLVNSAQSGSYVDVTLGQPGIGDGYTCPLFDGTDSYVNLYTTALRDVFDGACGTILVWGKVLNVDVWENGVSGFFLFLGADFSANYICIQKSSETGMRWRYRAGGVEEHQAKTGLSEAGWMSLALTWDAVADEVKAYWQGEQEGDTLTGLGTWAGNLASNAVTIGSMSSIPVYVHYGWLAHAALWDKVLAPTQIADLAKA